LVLNSGLLATAAGLIVLGLRRIRSLPRFGVYLLWILPFVRFWMPIGIANRYSLLNFLSKFTTKTIVIWEPASLQLSMTNSMQAAESYFPIVYKTDLLKDIFNIAGLVWIIVALAAVLCALLLYIFTKSALRDAVHSKQNIYRSNTVLSPSVYGIIKPKIILPAGIPAADLDFILQHESIHIRRRDNLWRVAAILTACVHWFNPFSWIFLKCFFADMELACDAGVLKNLSADKKKAYASAVLSCSAGKTYYASAFGGAKTKLRIERILSYKKLTLLSGICFAILFLVIAATVITNASVR
jgi:beta-lactamase regulating signal transducer with metallopeptidase domain